MPATEYAINRQFDILQNAYRRLKNSSFDTTSGIYGEQARLQRQIGSTLAATGANVGGTANRLPLFQVGADFSNRRVMARTAYEQAKFQNFLNIANLFGQNAQLGLQKNAQDYEQAFNLGDLLGLFNIQTNLNPFGGGSQPSNVPDLPYTPPIKVNPYEQQYRQVDPYTRIS